MTALEWETTEVGPTRFFVTRIHGMQPGHPSSHLPTSMRNLPEPLSRRAEEIMLEVQRLARQPEVARLESAPRLTSCLPRAPMSAQAQLCANSFALHSQQGAVPRLASPPMRGRPSSGGPIRNQQRNSHPTHAARPYVSAQMPPPSRRASAPAAAAAAKPPFHGLTTHPMYSPHLIEPRRASPPCELLEFALPQTNQIYLPQAGVQVMSRLPTSPQQQLQPCDPQPCGPCTRQPQQQQQPQQQPQPQPQPSAFTFGPPLGAPAPAAAGDNADVGVGDGLGDDQPLQLCDSSSTIHLPRDEKDAEAAEFLLSLSPGKGAHALSASVSLLNTPDLSVFDSPRCPNPLPMLSPRLPANGFEAALPSPLGLGARYASASAPTSAASSYDSRVERTPSTQQAMAPARASGWGANDRMSCKAVD